MDAATSTTERIELKTRRWLTAAFLTFWLSGWAAGELTVLLVLGKGAVTLVQQGRAALSLEALGVASFLLLWLALWTVGGLGALRELGRCVAGRDDVLLSPARVTFRAFPFGRWRSVPRSEVARVHQRAKGGALWLWTTSGEKLCISSLGTPEERAALQVRLMRTLDLDPRPGAARLPPGWLEAGGGEALPVVVFPPSGGRRFGAACLAAFSASAMAIAVLSPRVSSPVVLAAGLGGLALAGWFLGWRRAWTVQDGTLALGWSGPFAVEPRRLALSELRLVHSTDSDGDDWHTLSAIVTGRSHTLTSSRDELDPDWLGRWLSGRLGVPLREEG